jgi:HD-like signal output (HDOD) protein
MQLEKTYSSEYWVDVISHKELPAITSLVRVFDDFLDDNISSLPLLSKAILHDPSFSSCLLKVANNCEHGTRKKVTTISRAAIVLGTHEIKNICMTAKLLEGLLTNETVSSKVHKRLKSMISCAFYAGILAKMMVPDYSDEVREEVYIAAMLHNIGEMAFWSTGHELTVQLIEKESLSKKEFEAFASALLGISFDQLSLGLSRQWNLGSLLDKSLSNLESQTVEIQVIGFANELSSFISAPPESPLEFNELLINIAGVMNISKCNLLKKIRATQKIAVNLLLSYGSNPLTGYIKALPEDAYFSENNNQLADSKNEISDAERDKEILNTVQELMKLMHESKDLNKFVEVALAGISKATGFDRSSFWMLSKKRDVISTRFTFMKNAKAINFDYSVDLITQPNVMNYILKNKEPITIENTKNNQWQDFISKEIDSLMGHGGLCLFPVKIGDVIIGVISGQTIHKNCTMKIDAFKQFSFLVEHLNMCLTMVIGK